VVPRLVSGGQRAESAALQDSSSWSSMYLVRQPVDVYIAAVRGAGVPGTRGQWSDGVAVTAAEEGPVLDRLAAAWLALYGCARPVC